MRSPVVIAVLAVLVGSSGPVLAQSYPLTATVSVPKVEVRSGPTDKYYPTLELSQGSEVLIIRPAKEVGWLEIEPPVGSFTWVNVKSVKVLGVKAIVIDANPSLVAKGLIGSNLFKGKPTVEAQPGLQPGTILAVFGPPQTDGGETWLPVVPAEREVRYLPASAVNLPATVAAPANWSVGSKTAAVSITPIPGYPAGADAKPVAGSTTSFSTPSIPGPPTPAATSPKQWSTWGTLQATSFVKDGQTVYVLVGPRGEPLLYATSVPGTSLKSYVNRRVTLFGQLVNRPDPMITVPTMVASHVATP